MKPERWFKQIQIILILTMAGCSPASQEKPRDTVTVQLKWVHQAQFAGFYVAKEKGYYAAEGLEVVFREGGLGIDKTRPVISGEVDFGIMTPEDVLILRSKGVELTAIAAIYRRSAVIYAAKADSGILRPSDFIGKTVAIEGDSGAVIDFEFQFHALMQRLNLDLSQVKMVPYDPNYSAFYQGTVDVTAAYLTGGIVKMRQKGLKLNLIWPGDYGIHFYSDIIVASEKTIAAKPELVTRFLRATLKGWTEAIGNPDIAVAATLIHAAIKDERLQSAMFEALVPLVHTGQDPIGWMCASDWQSMRDILFEQGVIKTSPDLDPVFTTTFLDKIYGSRTP